LIRLSKHAREKLHIRQIEISMIEDVLNSPEQRFYDTLGASEVAAKNVKLRDELFTLVVVYDRRDDEHYVTVPLQSYPIQSRLATL
jgi:hypothetical protein